MTEKEDFLKFIEVDDETLESLRSVAAIDQGHTASALNAMAGTSQMFEDFAEQAGILGDPECKELLELIRLRDQRRPFVATVELAGGKTLQIETGHLAKQAQGS